MDPRTRAIEGNHEAFLVGMGLFFIAQDEGPAGRAGPSSRSGVVPVSRPYGGGFSQLISTSAPHWSIPGPPWARSVPP
jgi:hypothetical protein